MKIVFGCRQSVLAACLVLAVTRPPGWGQDRTSRLPTAIKYSNALALYASLETDQVRIGDHIRILLRLKNVSSEKIELREWIDQDTGPYWDYEVLAVDAKGNALANTPFGRRVAQEERGGSAVVRPLTPGDELRKVVDVAKVWSIEHPGIYYVRVIGTAYTPSKTERVLSNIVRITLTE